MPTSHSEIPPATELAARAAIDAAFAVHKTFGPGLLEYVYETCLCQELRSQDVPFRRQPLYPVTYQGVQLKAAYRLDVVVDERVILELKAVEKIIPVHEAQLLSYLKLTGMRLGLLIHFNVALLKQGIKRMAL